MKLIVNERNGCCESATIECTPTEALVLNQAMRRYVDDEDMNEVNRKIMERMLGVDPIFKEIEATTVLDEIKAEIIEEATESPDSDDYFKGLRDGLKYACKIIDQHKK